MTKTRVVFACQACGFESSKWLGRCPDCGEWNSFVEERQEVAPPAGKGRPDPQLLAQTVSRPKPFDSIDNSEDARVASGIDEFDRVLGGGIVPGSLVLIGGEPGIGKSTLLLQVAHLLGRTHGSVLYVSGEESERQIKLRGERLGIEGGGLFVMAETSLERILEEVESLKPRGAGRSTRCRRSSRRASRRRPAASARCARWRRSCCSWPRAAASPRS